MTTSPRIAIVLFNLGGPDTQDSVQPFLYNLFNDPAIIGLPAWPRAWLARFIAARRAPKARAIYAKMGGGSPLLPNTEAQARALEAELADPNIRVFIAMRYWHPMIEEIAAAVKAFAPDRVILLPLYPQFSTTTTGSSRTAWAKAAKTHGLNVPHTSICCYPVEPGFISAQSDLIGKALAEARQAAPGLAPAVIFSAHGLPEKIVAKGDPYVDQVKAGAAAIAHRLGLAPADHIVAFQSRVGPLAWVKPATDETIRALGAAGRPIILVPIAFVSEHSETLVELDIEYRHLAKEAGAPA